jgi:hypothetical protein
MRGTPKDGENLAIIDISIETVSLTISQWACGFAQYTAKAPEPGWRRRWMRHLGAHLDWRLVLAQAFIHDLAQKIVAGRGEIFDLDDEHGTSQ